MKHRKLLIIIASVIFFLCALTFYLNRVVFPVTLKKIVITQAETFLKRKVEVGDLHFSWVRGFIVDGIKVYQKDSDQVFVQAERVAFGLVYIPGFKQQHVTIPFINIEHPSAHLIHTGRDQWNFSDLLAVPAKEETPSPVSVAVTGVHVINGKLRIDDVAGGKNWTELLDDVNVKIGLSLSGISFDVSAYLPKKQGMLAALGAYQPLNQSLRAQVRAKNIKPGEYLGFVPVIQGLALKDGLAQDVNVNVEYGKDAVRLQGDAVLKNVDLSFNGQNFAGSLEAHTADILYSNGPLRVKGNFDLTGVKAAANGMTVGGNLKARVNQFDMDKDAITVDGSFTAQNALLALSAHQSFKGSVTLDKIKARRDKEGTQLVGTVQAQDMDIKWDQQAFKGSILLKPVTVQMKDDNDINITGDLKAEGLKAVLDADTETFFQGTITAQDTKVHVTDKKNVDVTGKISVDDMKAVPAPNIAVTGAVRLPSFSLSLIDDTLAVKTQGQLNGWQMALGGDRTLTAESTFVLDTVYPLKDPAKLRYSGSLTVSTAEARGFPFGPFKDIKLDSVFKTDQFNIKLLSLTAMDTAIKAAGTVMNFKAPVLDLEASSEKIDLSKLKDVLPDVFNDYGLQTSGEASFNIQFQGLASDPLSGKIKAKAQLQNVNVASSKFNQSASNISGTVEATPNSASWDNFTGTYLGKTYTLTGGMTDFKNPRITTSLDGQDVQLKADLAKTGDLLSIKALAGKYLNITFSANGNVNLPAGASPVLDITAKTSLRLEDLPALLPEDQKKILEPLKAVGAVNIEGDIKGPVSNWKNWTTNAKVQSASVSVMGYTASDVNIAIAQRDGKVTNLTVDAMAYGGKIHTVGSSDLMDAAMPFEIALNVDSLDLHKLKTDIPNLKSEEINGKFYLTTVGKGKFTDIKGIDAKGSLAIREGFLTEFQLFKGLLGVLNEALRLGQVMITDVEGNFTIQNQKITTDNLRLKSPTIVLLTQGWVDMDQNCDLNVSVDMTSGVVPQAAEEVLRSLQIHIFDKITNPKFTKKISVPQVINSIIKTIGIFQ